MVMVVNPASASRTQPAPSLCPCIPRCGCSKTRRTPYTNVGRFIILGLSCVSAWYACFILAPITSCCAASWRQCSPRPPGFLWPQAWPLGFPGRSPLYGSKLPSTFATKGRGGHLHNKGNSGTTRRSPADFVRLDTSKGGPVHGSKATKDSGGVKNKKTTADIPREPDLASQLKRLEATGDRASFEAFLGRHDMDYFKEAGLWVAGERFVRAASRCGRLDLVPQVLDLLLMRPEDTQGRHDPAWRPQLDTFKVVLKAFRRSGQVQEMVKYFEASQRFSGFSKLHLFNIVLAGICESSGLTEATRFFGTAAREGASGGFVPNTISWNTLLSAALKYGQPDLFDRLEQTMLVRGVAQDVTTSNIKLQRLLQERPDDGLRFFERLCERHVDSQHHRSSSKEDPSFPYIDVVSMNTVADYLAKTRGFEAAHAFVRDVQASTGIKALPTTHNTLLNALVKEGKIDEALGFFYGITGVTADGKEGPHPGASLRLGLAPCVDSTTFDTILAALVGEGRMSIAWSIYHLMMRSGFKETIYTHAALVRMQRSSLGVYQVWASASSRHATLSLPFYNSVMFELGQVHDDLGGACRAFLALVHAGYRPSVISFNILIGALAKNPNATVVLPAGAPPQEPVYSPRLAHHLGPSSEIVPGLNGSTGLDACFQVLRYLSANSTNGIPRPNARTYTIIMAAVTRAKMGAGNNNNRSRLLCQQLFHDAIDQGVAINGILCHSLLMSFGSDVVDALAFFKRDLRPRLKRLMASPSVSAREEAPPDPQSRDLCLTYLALIHLCGVSARPDLALQIFYAMGKDGIGRTEKVWEAYIAGKEAVASEAVAPATMARLFMLPSYESVLRLESTAKADENIAKAIPWKRIRIKF